LGLFKSAQKTISGITIQINTAQTILRMMVI